jgi:type IV secretion system protein TrbL
VLHRDPTRLGRAVGMIAAAGLGTGAVLVITDLLLAISDQLSAAVAAGTVGDLRTALAGATEGLGSLTAGTGRPGPPLFAVMLAGLLAAAAAVVIWIELLLREVAIYAVVLFFPLALAGLAWDPARGWARKLAELLGALIFAKFVIVAVLSLAAGGLASAGTQHNNGTAGGGAGFGGVLAGSALLVVAAFAPFLLLRLIGVMEVAAAATVLEGARQRGTRPVVTGGRTVLRAAGHGGGSGGGAGAITVAAGGAPWAAIAARAPAGLMPPRLTAVAGMAPPSPSPQTRSARGA